MVLCTNDKHNPGRPSVVYHVYSLRDKLQKFKFLELKLVVHIPLLKVYFSKINTPKLLKLQNKITKHFLPEKDCLNSWL